MRRLFQSRLFLTGLALKLLCLPFFGSHYLRDLFIPFIDKAVAQPFANPWSLSPAHFFPYGSALYLFLFIPKLVAHGIFGDAALGDGPIGLAAMKFPLLVLDVMFFALLAKLCKERPKNLLVYYWLNPVLFFINYVYGQLDIAAMFFTVLSLSLIIEKRTLASAAAFAVATLCKFHVVLILPLILVHIWNREFYKRALKQIAAWGALWAVISAAGFLPVAMAGKFGYASAGSPEAFRLFAMKIEFSENQTLFLGIMLVLGLLGRLCIATQISARGIILGSGVLFGTLLLVTNPMPGWYFWVVPFVSLFFVMYVNIPKVILASFCFLYLAYFGVVHENPSITSPLVSGVLLTLLQTNLAGILVAMWVVSVKHEFPLLGRVRAVTIAIAGDSGAGKNHLSTLFKNVFDPSQTRVVEGDDYHRGDRKSSLWQSLTPLNPQANNLVSLSEHAQKLSGGEAVLQPHYDHTTGLFTPPRELAPTKTLIIQGLHSLYLRDLRRGTDIKIFVSPEPMIRMAWKIKRDVAERGHKVEEVLKAAKRREEDFVRHILPQKEYADLVIEYVLAEPFSQSDLEAGKQPKIKAKYVTWNDTAVVHLAHALARNKNQCSVEIESYPKDMNKVAVSVSGNPDAGYVEATAISVFNNIRQLTRGGKEPVWAAGYDGVHQLMLLSVLKAKMFNPGHTYENADKTSSESSRRSA